MWKFQLESLGNLDKQFLDTFKKLPETDHLDGKYRLRRYSVFKQVKEFHVPSFVKLPARPFVQSYHYNKHQGNIKRDFEPVSDPAAYSHSLQDILTIFSNRCDIEDGQEIEVHQMRVLTNDGGKLSPEGVHQDGFSKIVMVGVSRHNITGGHLLLYKSKDGDPIADFPLEDGEAAFLNDNIMWHSGSPLKKINESDAGFMDLIICLVKSGG